jgi:hypothetical protein
MLAVQYRLPLAHVRTRHGRRPFHPSQGRGPYRLPHEIADRLRESLVPFRNRDAAFTLAVFLARFWSAPGRIVESFHVDRRALADHADLGLTEKRVRSAIRTLEAIGFLDRAIPAPGSRYKSTADGLHRKPILFAFGPDYAPAFIAANRRAAARGRPSGARRAVPSSPVRRSSTATAAGVAKGPKSKSEADPQVHLGPFVTSGAPPLPSDPNSPLEAALERLGSAILNRKQP